MGGGAGAAGAPRRRSGSPSQCAPRADTQRSASAAPSARLSSLTRSRLTSPAPLENHRSACPCLVLGGRQGHAVPLRRVPDDVEGEAAGSEGRHHVPARSVQGVGLLVTGPRHRDELVQVDIRAPRGPRVPHVVHLEAGAGPAGLKRDRLQTLGGGSAPRATTISRSSSLRRSRRAKAPSSRPRVVRIRCQSRSGPRTWRIVTTSSRSRGRRR